jgi:hypothetical protein
MQTFRYCKTVVLNGVTPRCFIWYHHAGFGIPTIRNVRRGNIRSARAAFQCRQAWHPELYVNLIVDFAGLGVSLVEFHQLMSEYERAINTRAHTRVAMMGYVDMFLRR